MVAALMELDGCGGCCRCPTPPNVPEVRSRRYRLSCLCDTTEYLANSDTMCEIRASFELRGCALSNLVEALQLRVIQTNAEGGPPQVSTEALDTPDGAATLEIERAPVRLDSRVEQQRK